MLAYGSKRTLGNCITSKYRKGAKIKIKECIKNKKYGRIINLNEELI